jgi:DNA-binding GntR family transcriptional regulator
MEHDTGMSRQPRLFRRGAVYYFRAAIPRDLQAIYGKREIIYSLKTRDHREAERLVRQASASLDNEFDEKRARPTLVEPLRLSLADESAISHICDLWRHQCLNGDAFNRSSLLTDDELDEMEASRLETEKALRKAVARGRIEAIQPALQQHLAINGIAVTGDAEAQRKLGWAFLQTVAETHRDTMSRDQGEVVRTPPAPAAMAGRSTSAPIPGPNRSG